MQIVGPGSEVISAGAAVRNLVRAQLRAANVDFDEERGLFKSYFIVHVPAGKTLNVEPRG